MSLNEGQLDDLQDNTVVDGGAVQLPSVLQTSDKPITLIPETNELKAHSVQIEEDFEKKLPSMDVTLKLVEGNQTKLVDLEDVEADILGEGKVCQDKADEINATFEGLYDGPISRLHYTKLPSTLNFSVVKQHMRSRIAQEEAVLVSNFQAMVDQPLEDAKRTLHEMQDAYMHHIRGDFGNLAARAMDLPKKILEAKNLMVQVDRDFVNLSKIDLTSPPSETLNVNGNPKFDQLCQGMKRLFMDRKFKALVLAVGNEVHPAEAINNGYIMEFKDHPVTIESLINFYRYSGLVDYLDSMSDTVRSTIEQLEKIQAEGKGLQGNVQAIREYLTANGEELTGAAQYHMNVVRRLLDLNYLNFFAQELFTFFETQ
jgi:hypothetical protein